MQQVQNRLWARVSLGGVGGWWCTRQETGRSWAQQRAEGGAKNPSRSYRSGKWMETQTLGSGLWDRGCLQSVYGTSSQAITLVGGEASWAGPHGAGSAPDTCPLPMEPQTAVLNCSGLGLPSERRQLPSAEDNQEVRRSCELSHSQHWAMTTLSLEGRGPTASPSIPCREAWPHWCVFVKLQIECVCRLKWKCTLNVHFFLPLIISKPNQTAYLGKEMTLPAWAVLVVTLPNDVPWPCHSEGSRPPPRWTNVCSWEFWLPSIFEWVGNRTKG